MRVEFAAPVDPAPFAALPGVDDVRVEDATLHLRAVGDLDALVKLAATHHVVDLVSEPPELEEIFLSYFAGPDGPSPGAGAAGAGADDAG